MESASLCLHACMCEVRACTRDVKLDKARKKLKRHSFKGSSFQSVTENVQQQGHFFLIIQRLPYAAFRNKSNLNSHMQYHEFPE